MSTSLARNMNDDFIQCVIYDGNVKDAKIMGVEYIVSEKLFAGLPPAEKALWHSHVHEVKSGQLIAPNIPEVAEHALMEKLIHTYGKTWHTDLDKRLPLIPNGTLLQWHDRRALSVERRAGPTTIEVRSRDFVRVSRCPRPTEDPLSPSCL